TPPPIARYRRTCAPPSCGRGRPCPAAARRPPAASDGEGKPCGKQSVIWVLNLTERASYYCAGRHNSPEREGRGALALDSGGSPASLAPCRCRVAGRRAARSVGALRPANERQPGKADSRMVFP